MVATLAKQCFWPQFFLISITAGPLVTAVREILVIGEFKWSRAHQVSRKRAPPQDGSCATERVAGEVLRSLEPVGGAGSSRR